MKNFIKSVRLSLLNFKIKNRLFISSIVLTLFVIMSIYFLSQNIISNLIIQRQVDFQGNSFKQAENYFKSLFENVEGRVQRIYGNSAINNDLTLNYNSSDLHFIYNTGREIDNELDDIFFGDLSIENVILIGKNGYKYTYTPQNSGKLLEGSFNFQEFYTQSSLSNYFSKPEMPFYYTNSSNSSKFQDFEKQLEQFINNKIILVRTLKSESNLVNGIIIITFKNSFITNILSDYAQTQLLYLTDTKLSTIWTNDRNQKAIPDSSLFDAKTDSGYFIENNKQTDYLVTYHTLLKDKLQLMSRIPLSSIFTEKSSFRIYTLLFGICCLLYVLIVSLLFSKKITDPLNNLLNRISQDNSIIPKPTNEKSPFLNISLRKKIILFYLVSVILPNMIYISSLTYYSYKIYNKNVTNYTISTINLVKQNIDYKLKNINYVTEQFIFSNAVQEVVNTKKSEDVFPSNSVNLEKTFLRTKSTAKEFLTFNLYDLNCQSMSSSLFYDDSSVLTKFGLESFVSQLNKSNNRLVLLGASKDLTMNPVLFFARNIRSKSSNFGKHIGYSVFTLDQDFLNKIILEVKLGDSGYFFLMDPSKNILSNSNEDLTNLLMNSVAKSEQTTNLRGSYTINIKGKNYLIFFDTSNNMGFKIYGVIPSQEINQKVLPLIWYGGSFILLISLFIILISSIVSWGITAPLKRLQLLMGEVKKENFSVKMNYVGKDEIADLTRNFNDMVERLNKLVTENYQSKLRESELMFLEQEAQLNALQQQINPHFLYNTLEAIKWIAYKKGVIEICDMATALGKFFRRSITSGNNLVTFSDEIDHLNNYMYIQKIRFQDRFEINWEVDNDVLKCKTVKLTLQPIVENALLHGLETMEEGAILTIRGYISNNMVNFEIIDNGIGMNNQTLTELKNKFELPVQNDSRSSIGLTNVYNRMKLHFNSNFTFDILSEEGNGTVVKFSIPLLRDV